MAITGIERAQKTSAVCAIGAALLTAFACTVPRAEDAPQKDESVVLLHGMGRTTFSMRLLAGRFERAGFATYVFGYSAREESLEELTVRLQEFVESNVTRPSYHLVGHSLGNIVIRNGFAQGYPTGLKRIVMIAPPNGPTDLAQVLKSYAVYRWWTGDSGQKLADEDFYASLPVPDVEFGIIAGDKGQRLSFDEPNDGVVRVANTKLDGMQDWALVHRTHTFIMTASDTFELSLRFIETGSFEAPTPAEASP